MIGKIYIRQIILKLRKLTADVHATINIHAAIAYSDLLHASGRDCDDK